jgi:6-phosphogluconolactonase
VSAVVLKSFASSAALAEAAAQDWVARLQVRDPSRPYGVALAGGRIVKAFYQAVLALKPQALLVNVHFFWGDERCVPADHAESNFAVAQEHLLQPLGVPALQVHRIEGELDPALAARKAEEQMRRILPTGPAGQPRLDLVFLGMGEDGHVASLFPGEAPAAAASPAVYRPVLAPKPPPQRITLGYPAVAAAREVWVLASGSGKEAAFRGLGEKNSALPIVKLAVARSELVVYEDISKRE